MVVGERRDAWKRLRPLTGVLEHVLRSADVRHHRLVHECAKTFWSWNEWRGVRSSVKF